MPHQNTTTVLKNLARPLLIWYSAHRRSYPWREEATPYRVWISEVMLQQTSIETALPYFQRFIAALPDIRALADADDDRILKLWEGLGYYSRVRNLRKAARMILQDFGSQLPPKYDELLRLPGVGEYTAGALASIAFGEKVPAVDGNVLRVMARLLNDSGDITDSSVKKRLKEAVLSMLPEENPGDFNQALMELGETVCVPRTVPHCAECPFSGCCAAHRSGCAELLPVRAPKKERRVVKRTVLVILSEGCVLLHRRSGRGLLAGMWELPGVDGWIRPSQALEEAVRLGARIKAEPEILKEGRHLFSHIEWKMKGIGLRAAYFEAPPGFVWADAGAIREQYALPSAFKPFEKNLPK